MLQGRVGFGAGRPGGEPPYRAPASLRGFLPHLKPGDLAGLPGILQNCEVPQRTPRGWDSSIFHFFFLFSPENLTPFRIPLSLLSADDVHTLCQQPLALGLQEDPPSQETSPPGSLITLITQYTQPVHPQFLEFSLLKNIPFACSALFVLP